MDPALRERDEDKVTLSEIEISPEIVPDCELDRTGPLSTTFEDTLIALEEIREELVDREGKQASPATETVRPELKT